MASSTKNAARSCDVSTIGLTNDCEYAENPNVAGNVVEREEGARRRDGASLEVHRVGATRTGARPDVEPGPQPVAAGFDRVRTRDFAVDVADLEIALRPEEVVADAAEDGERRSAVRDDRARAGIQRPPVRPHPADHDAEFVQPARHHRAVIPGEEVVVIVDLQARRRQREAANEADVVVVGVVAEEIAERRDLRRIPLLVHLPHQPLVVEGGWREADRERRRQDRILRFTRELAVDEVEGAGADRAADRAAELVALKAVVDHVAGGVFRREEVWRVDAAPGTHVVEQLAGVALPARLRRDREYPVAGAAVLR